MRSQSLTTVTIPANAYAATIARLEMEGAVLLAVERPTHPRGLYRVTYLGAPPCPTRRPRHHHVARVFAVALVAIAFALAPRSAAGPVTLAASLDAPTGRDGALALGIGGGGPATGNLFPLETRGGVCASTLENV